MHSKQDWEELSRNLTIVASMADDFLDLSDDDKNAIFEKQDADRLSAYAGFHLAATIRQAKDMVSLLEKAESAWKEARDKAARSKAESKDERAFTTAD